MSRTFCTTFVVIDQQATAAINLSLAFQQAAEMAEHQQTISFDQIIVGGHEHGFISGQDNHRDRCFRTWANPPELRLYHRDSLATGRGAPQPRSDNRHEPDVG